MTDETRTPRYIPLALGVAATLVYLLTMQRQLWGDAIFFVEKMRLGGEYLIYNHLLYLPLSKLLQVVVSVFVTIDGEMALKVCAAVAGGVGVAMTFVLAEDCLRSRWRALSCAALVGAFVGYWFHSTAAELHSLHAACATVLLLSLFRTLDGRLKSPGSCAMLAAGAALTVASHVSGIGVALPMLYVFVKAGAARARFFWSAALGFSAVGIAYLAITLGNAGFAGYSTALSARHSVLWQEPGRVPGMLFGCAEEMFMYSIPASTLVPAGLRILFRTAPAKAWLCVLWMLAWPLIAWPVEDRALGSYYTPTFPAQALLAIVAMYGIGRSYAAAALGVLLSLAPAFAFVWLGERWGLGVAAIAALLLFAWTGRRRVERPLGTWLLPLSIAILSGLYILGTMNLDPRRDRIDAVARAVADYEEETNTERGRSLVIFLATETLTHHHWETFYPGARSGYDRALNPVLVGFQFTDAKAEAMLLDFRSRVSRAASEGRPIFRFGSPTDVRKIIHDARVAALLDHLDETLEVKKGREDWPAQLSLLGPR